MIRFTVILLLGLMLTGALQSCGNGEFKQTRAEMLERQKQRKIEYQAKKEAEEAEQARLEAEALAEARVKAERAAEAAPVAPIQLIEDSLLFHFERSPCFGRCPVYKLIIYESGHTRYEGINFVDNMGYYQAKISPSEIAQIYSLIAETNFFELNDVYDNENITDLPSMIFRARAMGQDKKIIARYEFPEALKEMATAIDEMFEDKDWQPSTSR